MKRFVKSMLSKLDISPSTTHVAAIAYSTYPVVEMRFWNSQSTDKSNDVIDAIPWQRGFTYTDKALQLAATDLFQIENGMRRDVNKVRQKLHQVWNWREALRFDTVMVIFASIVLSLEEDNPRKWTLLNRVSVRLGKRSCWRRSRALKQGWREQRFGC